MDAETVIALLDAPINEYALEIDGRDFTTGESGVAIGTIVLLNKPVCHTEEIKVWQLSEM